MSANINPIFPVLPRCQGVTLITAATEKDGSTATSLLEAGLNGTRIDKIIVKPIGTNDATVLRIFVTGTNINTIISEQTISASTGSETEALDEYLIALDLTIPPNSTLKVALGTTVASGVQVTVFAGDY